MWVRKNPKRALPKISEETLQDHVHNLLESAAAYFRLDKFTDILSTMNHIVSATATFRDDINGVLDAHNITFDILCQGLEDAFMVIIDGLEKIPPPDKAPGHAERLEMFDKIMNDTTKGITNFATPYGLEDEFSPFFSGLKPHVQSLIVTIGDINEQHPALLPVLLPIVATLLIPESWILRPFLKLFGFGPKGPVKGSPAAWLQSNFWGGAVKADSWFSRLQAAGMS
ncbi:hypothetical protein V8E55_000095 [Tylopilus felleus]